MGNANRPACPPVVARVADRWPFGALPAQAVEDWPAGTGAVFAQFPSRAAAFRVAIFDGIRVTAER